MKHLNHQIAAEIIRAQVASDGGKKEQSRAFAALRYINPEVWEAGYPGKDPAIRGAIKDILRMRGSSMFSYYVTRDERIGSYLVYFNYRLGGKRRQISFHTFGEYFGRFVVPGDTHRTKWDEGCSRRNAEELYRTLKEGGIL